ncbi:unnamed protein product, partial [Polarella glacialis]
DGEGRIDRDKVDAAVSADPAKLALIDAKKYWPILLLALRQILSFIWQGHRQIVLDAPVLTQPWPEL